MKHHCLRRVPYCLLGRWWLHLDGWLHSRGRNVFLSLFLWWVWLALTLWRWDLWALLGPPLGRSTKMCQLPVGCFSSHLWPGVLKCPLLWHTGWWLHRTELYAFVVDVMDLWELGDQIVLVLSWCSQAWRYALPASCSPSQQWVLCIVSLPSLLQFGSIALGLVLDGGQFFVSVFDAKVVYYQCETDGLPCVLPVAGHNIWLGVSCLEEVCL
jgi:hypothetical protein